MVPSLGRSVCSCSPLLAHSVLAFKPVYPKQKFAAPVIETSQHYECFEVELMLSAGYCGMFWSTCICQLPLSAKQDRNKSTGKLIREKEDPPLPSHLSSLKRPLLFTPASRSLSAFPFYPTTHILFFIILLSTNKSQKASSFLDLGRVIKGPWFKVMFPYETFVLTTSFLFIQECH